MTFSKKVNNSRNLKEYKKKLNIKIIKEINYGGFYFFAEFYRTGR